MEFKITEELTRLKKENETLWLEKGANSTSTSLGRQLDEFMKQVASNSHDGNHTCAFRSAKENVEEDLRHKERRIRELEDELKIEKGRNSDQNRKVEGLHAQLRASEVARMATENKLGALQERMKNRRGRFQVNSRDQQERERLELELDGARNLALSLEAQNVDLKVAIDRSYASGLSLVHQKTAWGEERLGMKRELRLLRVALEKKTAEVAIWTNAKQQVDRILADAESMPPPPPPPASPASPALVGVVHIRPRADAESMPPPPPPPTSPVLVDIAHIRPPAPTVTDADPPSPPLAGSSTAGTSPSPTVSLSAAASPVPDRRSTRSTRSTLAIPSTPPTSFTAASPETPRTPSANTTARRRSSSVASSSSRSSSANRNTNRQRGEGYTFLVSGELADGTRVSADQVNSEVVDCMEELIEKWKKNETSWSGVSKISHKRCSSTRVMRKAKNRNPPASEHPNEACRDCISGRVLCILVGENGPVVVPLPESLRDMTVTPLDKAFYLKPWPKVS
ncbi:hypothetical protein ONS96_008469 [Cadophora gregata f. sp. sojae]|nr:hypothetical protein ONS96_008469 [Cadophora gregata f. sp. sojae]